MRRDGYTGHIPACDGAYRSCYLPRAFVSCECIASSRTDGTHVGFVPVIGNCFSDFPNHWHIVYMHGNCAYIVVNACRQRWALDSWGRPSMLHLLYRPNIGTSSNAGSGFLLCNSGLPQHGMQVLGKGRVQKHLIHKQLCMCMKYCQVTDAF